MVERDCQDRGTNRSIRRCLESSEAERWPNGQTLAASPPGSEGMVLFFPRENARRTSGKAFRRVLSTRSPSIREAYSEFIITRALAERSEVRPFGCPSLCGRPSRSVPRHTNLLGREVVVRYICRHVQSSSQNRQVRSGCARRPDPTHVETVR